MMGIFGMGKNLSPVQGRFESFSAFKVRRKKNKKELEKYLRLGTAIWTSCVAVSDGLGIRKINIQGTRRGKFKAEEKCT